MKQFNLLLCCCLLAAPLVSSAQEFPNFGIASQADLNFKECAFDKDANAVILMHEAVSDYNDDHNLITDHHIRIKILKEKGFSSANVSIPFYRKDDFEMITAVEAVTINTAEDGQVTNTRVERKAIFTQKTNERYGEVIFTFPAIRTGSIIDYKYRSIMKHYGGLQDWEFQERLPVVCSKYNLIILPNMEFAYQISKAPDLPIIVKKNADRGGVYFEMNNIAGLGDEPYMDARADYVQKVVFQLSAYSQYGGKSKYMTSWDEVTREMLASSEFGAQLNKNIAGTGDDLKLINAMPLPEDRMKAVFNYVRNNMVWNDLYSKYAIAGVKEAWQKKTGTSGDINLLLVNLLKEAALDAYPMLVSERFHGKVNSTYPFIDQFNSVFACVIINGKKYYLDATDHGIPPHLTPVSILNTTAFIVNKKAGGLINISDDMAQFREFISADLDLGADGRISGEVSVKSTDYARIKKRSDYKRDKESFIKKYFIVNETDFAATEMKLTNLDNDSLPLEQDFKLSGTLNSTGDYSFIPLNLFTGFDTNPFLSENRFSNINFGYRRTVNLSVTVTLPAGYIVDELPKSVKMSNPEKDIIFIRQMDYDKEANYVRCMMMFEFKKSLYETEYYPVIKEVYQKIYGFLKEPVVVKKKR